MQETGNSILSTNLPSINELNKYNPEQVSKVISSDDVVIKKLYIRKRDMVDISSIPQHLIDALIVIGGNGSLEGASVFQKEHSVPFIGIPGTIDNDLIGTRCTLGYDTALNTVSEAIDKIRDTAISHNRLFFVEVMGKGTGHIALNAGIGSGAEEILIPEQNMGIERLLDSLRKSEKSGKTSSIIIVTEEKRLVKMYLNMLHILRKTYQSMKLELLF